MGEGGDSVLSLTSHALSIAQRCRAYASCAAAYSAAAAGSAARRASHVATRPRSSSRETAAAVPESASQYIVGKGCSDVAPRPRCLRVCVASGYRRSTAGARSPSRRAAIATRLSGTIPLESEASIADRSSAASAIRGCLLYTSPSPRD